MARSLCRLFIWLNLALVMIFNVTNMSFNAFRNDKILEKISEFTVSLKLLIFRLIIMPLMEHSECTRSHHFYQKFSGNLAPRSPWHECESTLLQGYLRSVHLVC